MAQLSLYLPPFSPDYSGAGAMLFDLDALTVMHDAGGCTGNYTGHDEPRWYDSRATVFCSGLRMIDAIMGNDQKLKDNVYAAIKTLSPKLIALVGSPVPMIIGMDLVGLAREIESETGIPAIGIETTGTDYYDIGAFKAAKALIDKFCTPEKAPAEKKNESFLSYNILGATPLDYERIEDLEYLTDILKDQGFSMISRPGYGYCLDELKNLGLADVNIAVSHAGFLTAQYMEKKYGIPYLCGIPVGEQTMTPYIEKLRTVARTQKSQLFFSEACTQNCKFFSEENDASNKKKKALIIGDQVIGESIKHCLSAHYDVTVGCIFSPDKDLPASSVLHLKSEAEIMAALSDEKYRLVAADPLFEKLLPENHKKLFIPIPQYAVSGDIYQKSAQPFLGKYFDELLRSFHISEPSDIKKVS